MSRIEPMIAELTHGAATTRRLLERLPQEKLAWKPHARSKSLGELAWHVVTIPDRISRFAEGNAADPTQSPASPLPATVAEILSAFDAAIAASRDRLSRLTETDLEASFTMSVRGKPLFQGKKSVYLRNVLLNHLYHHRGQLSVYLRLLDVPLPPIFGPTADESPFA